MMDNQTLLTTAALVLSLTAAHAAEMPQYLVGDWCQTSGNNTSGDYIKAKNFCKETRPIAFIVRPVGFWIKLSGAKTRIICAPTGVEPFAHGWVVSATCGADDNSTAVYQMDFVFEQYGHGPMMISSRRN
jgi:hypothetical protein